MDHHTRKLGLGAAIIELGEDALLAAATEQLSLLPTVATLAALGDGSVEVAQRSGPGRPAGSKNKATSEWVDFISARYRSPLLFLGDCYTRPVAVLAAELGCTLIDAFKLQIAAAKELAPYMHQKQPVAISVDGSGAISLIIERGPGVAAAPMGIEGMEVVKGEIIEQEDEEEDV